MDRVMAYRDDQEEERELGVVEEPSGQLLDEDEDTDEPGVEEPEEEKDF